MNNVLELKGKRFVQESKKGNGGGAAINSKVVVAGSDYKLGDKIKILGEEYTIIGIEGDDVLHNKVSTTINVIGDEAGALMTIFNFEDLPSVKDYKAIKNNFFNKNFLK